MKCPLITMSAVTGQPDKNQIFEYLKGLNERGIEQALIYPRSGCEIEYLSEAWFDTIGNFIECAVLLDMHLWLYDDFNWPSGDAGGRVSAIEEYRLSAIATNGEDIGKISHKSRHNSGLFGEKFFPNLLSYEAVDYFISCTHEEYYKRFGKYFGTVIKGIFTDEPSIGYCCENGSIPYYEGIEKDYLELCERDFYKDMLNKHKDFYLNAVTVISNRFNSCYISKLSSWCGAHKIAMTGHMMCDNNPFYATKHGGRFLKNLSAFTLPGIDEISTSLDDESELVLFGAAEYASGENGAMAELFALGPCDMSYAKKRCMLYLAAAFKINHYFLAISHLDMRGNKLVTDFFNNFNTDQPDFVGMKLLAMEAMQAGALAHKDFEPDVYIRYPYSPCAKSITGDMDATPICRLVNTLTYSGIQWKFIDDEEPVNAPIIEINDQLEFKINRTILSIEEICKKIRGSISVADKNGGRAKGILVRRFKDGSMVILNLFAPPGEYIINGKGIFLDKYDVKLSTDSAKYKKEEISPSFNVEYKNDNIIRTMYVNGTENAHVYCQKDTEATLAVRNGTAAYLNGEPIKADLDAKLLPYGMRKLYKISAPVSLKAGLNTLKANDDLKYLPSVLIIGDFSADSINGDICKLELRPRKNALFCGDYICDYGRVSFTANIKVPKGVTALEISGTELYTAVYADGKPLGEKIFSPYIFNIEAELWGKDVCLEIVQLSSMGNIFGNVDYWDKVSEKSQWRGTPTPHKTVFGFCKINWLFD